MVNIAELTVLLRGRAELPDNLELATEEFREGWNFVRSGGARRLDKQIRRRGWHLIRIAEGLVRSGVGQTSQEAIACALKLALRCLSERFNTAEVEHIELKMYPWFFLAKVAVYPYQIQRSAVLSVSDEAVPLMSMPPAEAVAITGNQLHLQLSSEIPCLAGHSELFSSIILSHVWNNDPGGESSLSPPSWF
jgi:hypothetical protein